MQDIMWSIDGGDVRPGRTGDETWNGFAVVYVTEETLLGFIAAEGGEAMVTDEGIIARWPEEWGADDDLLSVALVENDDDDVYYSLHGWCVDIMHNHTFRQDIADMWCEECDTVTDYCRQINPF